MARAEKITLYAVGDVGMTRKDAMTGFAHVMAKMHEPDIMFGQLEANLSLKGISPPMYAGSHHSSENFAEAVQNAGFHIMSFASNHCMFFGHEGLLDTIKIAKHLGIQLVGVGKDIEEARAPAILERKGTKVGFLAYNSVLKPDDWADVGRPGCAPIRVRTFYEPGVANQPGAPADVLTFALEEDVEALISDIKKTRPLCDVLIVSIHWGVPFMQAKIDMYQRAVGHTAIDAGADIVLGHHAHILRGIEVYKGKAIFYSLGNWTQDASLTKSWPQIPPKWQKIERLYGYKIDPEWGATYPFPADARKTFIAKTLISGKKIEKVSFLPAFVNSQNQPEMLATTDPRFKEVADYVESISRDQKLDVKLSIEGDEVVVKTGA